MPFQEVRTKWFCPKARLKQCQRGSRGWFLSVSSGRRPQNASAAPAAGPHPAHEDPGPRDLLTGLDGQEVVEFVQHLQQGRLLLGLTELRAQDSVSGAVGKEAVCLALLVSHTGKY